MPTLQSIARVKMTPEIAERLEEISKAIRKAPKKIWAQEFPGTPSSYVVEDGDDDKTLINGVRVAYAAQHRNGFQHGRIRNVNGNLVLMPKKSDKPAGAQKDATPDQLAVDLLRAQRELELALRQLAILNGEL